MKTTIALCSLAVACVLCWSIGASTATGDPSGIFDPCSVSVDIAPGSYCWVTCPQGDGPPLNALSPAVGDATISVTVKDLLGAPIPRIPAADFWLFGCNDGLPLCGGSGAIDADGASDANGQTTISGVLAAGGCDVAVSVIVQGVVVLDENCLAPLCIDIAVHSPDGDGDGQVINLDFNQFGNAWEPLGGTYDACMDFDCSGSINALDFTVFGNHWQHACL